MLFTVSFRSSEFCGSYSACFINDQILLDLLDWTTACVCSEVPDAMFVKAHAASNCKEGLQNKKKKYCNMNFQPELISTLAKFWEFSQCNIPSCRNTHLSSLSRQCTKIGNIPDFIRSSIGGLRSLESSFLFRKRKQKLKSQNEKRGLGRISGGCLVQPSVQSAAIAIT